MSVSARTTAIAGLLLVKVPVHEDARGWFKENWQRSAMTTAGLPVFDPVQQNVAFNHRRGTTRGFHAEPWDKLVSVATGRVFGAWVDLREGDGFGTVVHAELGPPDVVFVPRGVGNAYQTLVDGTAYSLLVNQHWSPDVPHPALDLDDPVLAVPWPIPIAEAIVSDQDRRHPRLADVVPLPAGG